jgi:hypothetical protein
MNPAPSPFIPGRLYHRRKDIHSRYKGQERGGIITPAKEPFIIIVSGSSGRRYGYKDEWSEDRRTFYYYGEGQTGDMQFIKGNKALRDHEDNHKDVHLFEEVPKKKGWLRYVGPMRYLRSEIKLASDTNGNMRKAILFVLEPITTPHDSPSEQDLLFAASESLGGGQRFSVDPRTRKAVEDHALGLAKAHFADEGYHIEVKGKPFDLQCKRADEILYVEVKGTQTDGEEILLTSNEVDFANKHASQMALFIVRRIRVSSEKIGPIATGGDSEIVRPWRPLTERLTPIAYSYRLEPQKQDAKAEHA